MGLFSSKQRRVVITEADTPPPVLTFEQELTHLINKYSMENLSRTPDFILAYYLKDCLFAYQNAQQRRLEYYNAHIEATKEKHMHDSRAAPL